MQAQPNIGLQPSAARELRAAAAETGRGYDRRTTTVQFQNTYPEILALDFDVLRKGLFAPALSSYGTRPKTGRVAVQTAKQEVQQLLEELPDDATLEDIQYHLYVK